jgi:hypothetical protein
MRRLVAIEHAVTRQTGLVAYLTWRTDRVVDRAVALVGGEFATVSDAYPVEHIEEHTFQTDEEYKSFLSVFTLGMVIPD